MTQLSALRLGIGQTDDYRSNNTDNLILSEPILYLIICGRFLCPEPKQRYVHHGKN